MNNLEIIKEELNVFIEKFYKNQFLKGVLLLSVVFLSSLYLVSLAEFYGRFNSTVRFLFLSLFVLKTTVFIQLFGKEFSVGS